MTKRFVVLLMTFAIFTSGTEILAPESVEDWKVPTFTSHGLDTNAGKYGFVLDGLNNRVSRRLDWNSRD